MTPTTVRVFLINNLIILKFKLDQAKANENILFLKFFSNIASWNTIKQSDILFKPLTNQSIVLYGVSMEMKKYTFYFNKTKCKIKTI